MILSSNFKSSLFFIFLSIMKLIKVLQIKDFTVKIYESEKSIRESPDHSFKLSTSDMNTDTDFGKYTEVYAKHYLVVEERLMKINFLAVKAILKRMKNNPDLDWDSYKQAVGVTLNGEELVHSVTLTKRPKGGIKIDCLELTEEETTQFERLITNIIKTNQNGGN